MRKLKYTIKIISHDNYSKRNHEQPENHHEIPVVSLITSQFCSWTSQNKLSPNKLLISV